MEEKSYLKEAFTAHLTGNEEAARNKLNEGLNYYSSLILSTYSGRLASDLPLIVVALKSHYEINLELCGDFGREIVKILTDRCVTTCIHN